MEEQLWIPKVDNLQGTCGSQLTFHCIPLPSVYFFSPTWQPQFPHLFLFPSLLWAHPSTYLSPAPSGSALFIYFILQNEEGIQLPPNFVTSLPLWTERDNMLGHHSSIYLRFGGKIIMFWKHARTLSRLIDITSGLQASGIWNSVLQSPAEATVVKPL